MRAANDHISFCPRFTPISADHRSGDLYPIFFCCVIQFVKKSARARSVAPPARAQKMTNGL